MSYGWLKQFQFWSRPKGGTEVEIAARGAMLDELSVRRREGKWEAAAE